MSADTTTHERTKLNVAAIIRHFGDAANLARLAKVHDILAINHSVVRKWKERGNIPTPHLMNLIWLAEKIGKPIDLTHHTFRG
jgi:hypothetical protein